jgi:two-component system, LytTR family, sensor kinase
MGRKKQLSVIINLQILFWVAFVFLSTYSFSQTASLSNSIIRTSILVPLNALLFYTCYLYLIPQYFDKKKFAAFYTLLILLLTAVTAVRLYLRTLFFDVMEGSKINIAPNLQIILIIISQLLIVLISVLMRVASDRYEYERKYQETQNQFLKSELMYLKSQISPHFLLNSLNNIYSFAVTNSPQTPGAVLKLSEILKYFLYESNGSKIALHREIEVIQAYIELFRLRFEDNLNITMQVALKNTTVQIEPLLLMSLVENAFKHSGIGLQDNAFITITAEENESQLIFTTLNSIIQTNETVGQYGGIGLQNISKRMALNYPGKHELTVTEKENIFSVKLVIPFL